VGTGRPLEYGVGAYYDDYPIICRQGLEQSSLGTAKVTLGLLGFDCSSGKPREPNEVNVMLGVEWT